MNINILFILLVGTVRGIAIQKILRPNSTTVLSEIVSGAGMGVTVDVSLIEGSKIFLSSGMKNKAAEKLALTQSYKRNLESTEPGEFELKLINESSEYVRASVSIFVDQAHEDTDEAEVLRKLLDKVRVDLVNIYNDSLKLKNMSINGLGKGKSAKKILWIFSVFPLLYVFLSVIRLRFIKSFFSNKGHKKI
ncbi:hypothetical protein NEFER03_0893 [Nematocida sp. LUAm3]|nr:hypothetical protein NEFER03_0893 [Nematocida sp. LUAm3]KAI5174911.1 hypothetical protein NEFER02_1011 [Nematocida sp. LUAm2]KAI5177491.1 hypothetical protein NEFER01_0741 [Nematocida sp. LUAm1]